MVTWRVTITLGSLAYSELEHHSESLLFVLLWGLTDPLRLVLDKLYSVHLLWCYLMSRVCRRTPSPAGVWECSASASTRRSNSCTTSSPSTARSSESKSSLTPRYVHTHNVTVLLVVCGAVMNGVSDPSDEKQIFTLELSL